MAVLGSLIGAFVTIIIRKLNGKLSLFEIAEYFCYGNLFLSPIGIILEGTN